MTVIKDAARLKELAASHPNEDETPMLVFKAQMRLVLRDWLNSSKPEEIEWLRMATVDQVWEKTVTDRCK